VPFWISAATCCSVGECSYVVAGEQLVQLVIARGYGRDSGETVE